MKKLLIICATTLMATGCANKILNPLSSAPSEISDRTFKIFIGVPATFSMEGSAVRLDQEWMITASHNQPVLWFRDNVIYHPHCDIALYRNPTSEPVEKVIVTEPEEGTPILFAGYPLYYPLASDGGKHIMNATFRNYPNCTKALADVGVMSGMSGGGAWNPENGELIGIIHGWTRQTVRGYNGASIYTPIHYILEWIEEKTGNHYGPVVTKNTPT